MKSAIARIQSEITRIGETDSNGQPFALRPRLAFFPLCDPDGYCRTR